LKRNDLPRPFGPIPDFTVSTGSASQSLVEAELVKLLKHDEYAYPVVETDGKKRSKKRKKDVSSKEIKLDIIPEDALDKAKEMLNLETEQLVKAIIFQIKETNGNYDSDDKISVAMTRATVHVSREGASNLVYQENESGYVENGNELEALKSEFQTIREATMALRKKNDKITAKLSIKNGGYNLRAKTLQDEMLQYFALRRNHKIEQVVFDTLASMEERGAIQRTEGIRDELAVLEREEAALQKQYGDLLLEKKRLAASLKTSQ
jgi:hypothetical protein